MKKILVSTIAALVGAIAFANVPTQTVTPPPFDNLPAAKEPAGGAKLSPRDRAALEAYKKWEQTGTADALVGENGEIRYPYDFSRPTVTCAPLHVCTIRLIPGETITSIALGDTVRWLVQQTTAGDRPVIFLKPTQGGISTNLAVTTDAGRLYYLHVVASAKEYTPIVGFYDPADMLRKQTAEAREIERLKKQLQAAEESARLAREEAERRAREHKERTVVAEGPAAEFDPTKLDFSMRCEANSRAAREFVPTQVFATKTHTFIQLPDSLEGKEIPAVFRKSGAQLQLLNVRRSGSYLVVDGTPNEISLALDVGSNARVVDCVRK
ncbi:TrbG/VirB9 family P-type conjugative transfer protein [Tepidimonas charontis]|uniref:P-type conjugative transfer protein TrbG n=1 Tax=Tepidimonas charontis TaxID=2267262 RepID=A0A554XH43_9BURK|nr:TrbG/VirB9 family P-type conjugative transfer protein [Tepidimonas charontis]TSE35142.1 P-type conjugative transfer protein TrbG [Tepidimonas charontis]